MLTLLSKVAFSVARTKIPLTLTFPFQYTLDSAQFAFMDVRFTQIPLNRELWQPEKEHIHLIIKRFEKILNGSKDRNELDKYIWNDLRQKAVELNEIAKESQFQLRFDFDLKSVGKSSGFYQIKPNGDLSLDQKDIQHIHNYNFKRQKQMLQVEMKEKKIQLTPEEQLKKDMLEKTQGQSKQLREEIQKMVVSKHSVYYHKFYDGLMSIGKKENKSTKFEPYYIIEQIKGTLGCEMHHCGNVYSDQEIQFDSKWLYLVTNLESNDLKKYRRRTLFDFQFWQRGCLFPVKNFGKELELLS